MQNSKLSSLLPFVLASLALNSALWAQGRDLRVARQGGNDVFREIRDAVAAAQDGDRIHVAAGTYKGFEIDKALTIRASGGVVMIDGTASDPAIVAVRNLGAAKTVHIENTLWFGNFGRGISVTDCKGSVLIEGLTMQGHGNINIARSRNVSLRSVYLTLDSGALSLSDARVALHQCTIEGRTEGRAPVEAARSMLECTDLWIRATRRSVSPAIRLQSSFVALHSVRPEAGQTIQTMVVSTESTVHSHAVAGTGSLIVLAPNYSFRTSSTQGEQALDPRLFTSLRDSCGLSLTRVTDSQLDLQLRGTADRPVALYLGALRDAEWLVSLDGLLAIDPLVLLGVPLLKSARLGIGEAQLSIQVPQDPALRGLAFGLQGISLDDRGLVLTNSGRSTLR